VQQDATAIGGDIDVIITVVIVVTDGTAQEMAGQLVQAHLPRRVREAAMPIAFIEGEARPYKQNIKVAVVVVVQERAAVTDCLQDVERPRSGNTPAIIQSGLCCDIDKQRRGLWWADDRSVALAGTTEQRQHQERQAEQVEP